MTPFPIGKTPSKTQEDFFSPTCPTEHPALEAVPPLIAVTLAWFSSCFTQPSFNYFCWFILGFMSSHLKLTVTSIYWQSTCQKHFTNFYRFLSKYRWSISEVANRLLELVFKEAEERMRAAGQEVLEILLVIDDTYVKKFGKFIYGVSRFFNSHKGRNQPKYIFGNCWVTMGIALGPPFDFVFLPIYTLLYVRELWTKKKSQYRTKIQIASKGLSELLFPSWVRLTVAVDCMYTKKALIKELLVRGYHLIGRAASNAVFYHVAAQPKKRKRGRPKKYGKRLNILRFFARVSRNFTILGYSGKPTRVKIASKAVVSSALKRTVLLVLVQFQQSKHKSIVRLVCTDLDRDPVKVAEQYCRRWEIETGFFSLKEQFGLTDYMVRIKESVLRNANLCLWAYSLTTLLGKAKNVIDKKLFESIWQRPWYKREHPSAGQMRQVIAAVCQRAFFRVHGWLPGCSTKKGHESNVNIPA